MADLETYLKITDPVKHHEARIKAAELLDKYRVDAAMETPPPPAPPAPIRTIPPPAVPAADDPRGVPAPR
jgi:hypothetical protein